MKKKHLLSKFDALFKTWGYKRSNTFWKRVETDHALLLIFRKSLWSARYFFDIGICFEKDAAGIPYAKPKDLDLSIAADHLIPGLDTKMVDRALDMEISNDASITALIDFLKSNLPPYLEKMKSLAGLKAMHDQGLLASAATSPTAQKILSAPSLTPLG